MYDELRLPPEVILLLITHSISESRKRGGGRMPSMRYIEKTAFAWEREGIFSMEQAEEYLKNLEVLKSARGKVNSALQIMERELSESQKRYVDSWIAMGFDSDAIGIAYDRTMLNTNRLAWGYLDKILCSWHENGLHTSQEILSKDSNRPSSQPQASNRRRPPTYENGQKFGSADIDDIERMKRLLIKTKEE
jgi:DnaD/phage-associated family protein